MMQAEVVSTERRSWWGKLFGALTGRGETYELPSDSLFAESWDGTASAVADVPEQVKKQIEEEAVLAAFSRLGHSLRLLMHATVPGKEPPTAEGCHQILNVWRYELEHSVKLIPDSYCGALLRYKAGLEDAYVIHGRCQAGDLLQVAVPCWRMYDRIVIRGELEIVDNTAWKPEGASTTASAADQPAAAAERPATATSIEPLAATSAADASPAASADAAPGATASAEPGASSDSPTAPNTSRAVSADDTGLW